MSKSLKFLESIGLVTLSEPKVQEVADVSEAPSPPVSASPSATVVSSALVDSSRFAEVDRACRERLKTAMDNDGAPLPEEFVDTLAVLDTIPTEDARYKTALNLMAKRGHTTGAILSDYDKTLGALDATARSFEDSLKAQIEAKVGAKHARVETLSATIEERRAQIQALHVEIETLTVERDHEQSGITEEQAKITTVQQRFKVIFASVKSEIQGQRAKISQYGGI